MRHIQKNILKAKNTGRGKEAILSSEKINLEEYKNLLLKKLKDTLEIAGLNMNNLRVQKSISQYTTMPINLAVDLSK
jgi:hypothetical protein